jgi:uncharacterized membrane protein YedE/YeeE
MNSLLEEAKKEKRKRTTTQQCFIMWLHTHNVVNLRVTLIIVLLTSINYRPIMHIAENSNLPAGLLGGVILGLSSSALLFGTGKINGISGIFENFVLFENMHGNIAYVMGLIASGWGISMLRPESFGNQSAVGVFSPAELVLAGVLVGFGSRLGSGCTSGHGLCGLSRLSPRSLAAVGTFMATGALSAYVTKETTLLDPLKSADRAIELLTHSQYFGLSAAVLSASGLYFFWNKNNAKLPSSSSFDLGENITCFLTSAVFGLGLAVSGMCDPARVQGFLNFSGRTGWDISLIGVMGAGVVVNFIFRNIMTTFNLSTPFIRNPKKLSAVIKMGAHDDNLKIDRKLIFGSAIFGLGWGMAGMCPGPALVGFGGRISDALLFIPAMMTGIIFQKLLNS